MPERVAPNPARIGREISEYSALRHSTGGNVSQGKDSRTAAQRAGQPRAAVAASRSSRTSVEMTAERARAIQAHADRTNSHQDFKARAMAAAALDPVPDEASDAESED
jgi:hypothetical protein